MKVLLQSHLLPKSTKGRRELKKNQIRKPASLYLIMNVRTRSGGENFPLWALASFPPIHPFHFPKFQKIEMYKKETLCKGSCRKDTLYVTDISMNPSNAVNGRQCNQWTGRQVRQESSRSCGRTSTDLRGSAHLCLGFGWLIFFRVLRLGQIWILN